jgi:hypothetical protein
MIADCESGIRDAIIVYNTDRLTRRLQELAGFLTWLQRHGITYADTEGTDTTTANGRMVIQIKGAVAQQEAERISERVVRANQQAAEQGRPRKGGLRPYGFEDDRLTVIESEAAALREAAARVLSGEPLGAIARDLNERSISTVTGRPWSPSVLRVTLLRPRTAGLREHRGEIVGEALWPAIVDRETWEEVCLVLRNPGRKTAASNTRKHLLSGIAACGSCGALLRSKAPHEGVSYHTYVCPVTKAQGCPKPIRRNMDRVDLLVSEAIIYHLETMRDPCVKPTAPFAGEIRDSEAKIARLRDAWSAAEVDDEDYFPMLRGERERLRQLRLAQAAQMRQNAVSAMMGAGARASWESASLARKRAVIAELVESVVIRPVAKRGRGFDPATVEIHWKPDADA